MSFAALETTLSRLVEEFFLSFGCLDIYIRLPSSPEKKGKLPEKKGNRLIGLCPNCSP